MRIVVLKFKLVTGRGPGDAMLFALKLVEILNGKEKMEELKKTIIF